MTTYNQQMIAQLPPDQQAQFQMNNQPVGTAPAPAAPEPEPVVPPTRPPQGDPFPKRYAYPGDINANPPRPHPDLITGLLFALIVVNGFTSGHISAITGVMKGTSKDTTASHNAFLMLGGEIVFAIGLSLIAGINDAANKLAISLVLGLWLLWGVQNFSHIQNLTKKTSGK